jgi:dTMP kinase
MVALVTRLTGNEFAVAAMLLARMFPALVLGPVAGIIVDRWNRKLVMVASDLTRAALICTLPFLDTIARAARIPDLVLLLLISAALETFTLLWQSAKDASLPLMLKPNELTHANSLISLAAYGTFPLSGALFTLLVPASKWLGRNFEFFSEFRFQQEHLAFFVDGITFFLSAVITATLLIPRSPKKKLPLNVRRALNELGEGIRFIARHPRVKPWVFGIGMIYAGVGAFLAIAVFFVEDVLGAGQAGFGLLVTAVGAGLGLGFALAGVAVRLTPRDVLFSASAFGLGLCMVAFASVSTLTTGVPVAVILGLFAGLAYPSGVTLIQESVDDDIRGRVVASTHSVIRLALVGALAAAPALSKLLGDHRLEFLSQTVDLRGTRVVLWAGGLFIIGAGLVTMRAVAARWRGLAVSTGPGVFLVFEGGEGAGKSTQMARLTSFLRDTGHEVLITREPGGTAVGDRIRQILLDPEMTDISAKTEALLYAADRAQHVEEKIRPALDRGEIVISDRYLDSSLAYQGLARGLGVDDVFGLNQWGTAGLLPDVVFFLDCEPEEGLRRGGAEDRIEKEDLQFHVRVRDAYRSLSERYPRRFVVLDEGLDADEVFSMIRDRVVPILEARRPSRETEQSEVSSA